MNVHLLILCTSFKNVVLPDPEEPTTTVNVMATTVAFDQLHKALSGKEATMWIR